MDDLKLILRFKLASDPNFRVHGAARLKIDGQGGLIVYSENGTAEKIVLSEVVSMSIRSLASGTVATTEEAFGVSRLPFLLC